VNTLCIRPEALNNASKTLNNAANALCTDSGTFTIAANTLSITPDTLCIAANTLTIGSDTLSMEQDTLNIGLNTFNNPAELTVFCAFQRLGRLPLFLFSQTTPVGLSFLTAQTNRRRSLDFAKPPLRMTGVCLERFACAANPSRSAPNH
jgi:hypothetical protein